MNDVKGLFTPINGVEYYKISNYDKLKPFLITLATDSDLWIYLSSHGGITAGRKDNDSSIFPYVIEDTLHHSEDTGSKTIIRLKKDNNEYLWQPFDNSYIVKYKTIRNMYKSIDGTSVIFEEINDDLELSFSYKWETCEKYGFVRTAYIKNLGNNADIDVLDGVINIIPYGVKNYMQKETGCLVDGYKRTTATDRKGVIVYALASAILDKPEPAEILKSTVFWNIADFNSNVYFEEKTLADFAASRPCELKSDYIGGRGCYLMNFNIKLENNETKEWKIIGDTGYSQKKVSNLIESIPDIRIEDEIHNTVYNIMRILSKTDGMQCTGDKIASVHHMSNVTYNDMRGGLFLDGYKFDYNDFIDFVKVRNTNEYSTIDFDGLKKISSTMELKNYALDTGDSDLIRLAFEYIPISFSRRHGDPSRPWNRFSIVLKKSDGTPITNYEGNWRDIFQNWEAMCLSYPEYYENIIAKFMNASSVDGYNPYRLEKSGIDWEKTNTKGTWSTLGYWSDHQIIYLVRLVEWLEKYSKKNLQRLIENISYSYANIPYDIAVFDEMVKHPKQTIKFDFEKNTEIEKKCDLYGTDGKLILQNNEVYHVSFAEKFVLQAMTKMSNHVIGGGIWMNTQRPEWNDANNAIVGYGLSVVTACQLKRYMLEGSKIFEKYTKENFTMSSEVASWLNKMIDILCQYKEYIDNDTVNDRIRFDVLEKSEQAFDEYRTTVSERGFSGKQEYSYSDILDFFDISMQYIEYTIRHNKRSDGLFSSYNLLSFGDREINIKSMQPMLEGQVAVLGSDTLTAEQSVKLIEDMFASDLYSEREKSFYLYPIKMTKNFMQNNIIPPSEASKSVLIQKLLKDGNNTVIEMDSVGHIRFNSEINTAHVLTAALDALSDNSEYTDYVKNDYKLILNIFDMVFEHSKFIGRSQTMYKYEGIGCIYWHQNSKLCVSVQETLLNAYANGEEPNIISALAKLYKKISDGLGFRKSPSEWGTFPIDAYSHTPYSGGASQPVMTGQVKEDIITRMGELGVIVNNNCIEFHKELVNSEEYLKEKAVFKFIDISDNAVSINLDTDSFAFTLCQVPIICKRGQKDSITVNLNNNPVEINSLILSANISEKLFKRTNEIKNIIVEFAD